VTKPTRPLLRYHGGKWKLAPWVIDHFPPHRTYVEPYGGGGSVLMRKARVDGEIYNDLDGEVVNVFRVLQDPGTAETLRRLIALTPFSREEFRRTYTEPRDAIEAAAFVISRSFMGFGSAASTRMHVTGFRASSKRAHGMSSTPAVDWANWPDQVPVFVARLRGVCIENRDAIAVMAQHDSPSTLHYVDPPYVQSTRSSLRQKNGNRGHYYRHDMADTDHERLAEFLHTVVGMVVLSGYPSQLYTDLYSDWAFHDRRHMADGGRARVERLWMNDRCARAQRQQEMSMEQRA
jgi:DNA adenine methylase